MKKILLLILVLAVISPSCKKNYDCQCTNSTGTYYAGTVEAKSKNKAKKKCEELSSTATTCGLK